MTQELPFFSVIIPTYNRPAQLAICLRALTRLEYPVERFEVIVVDDGSANPPRDIAAQFGEQLEINLLIQENKGPAGARNFGATQARGEFLAFTDDDCMPDAGWLRVLAAHLTRTPDRIIGGCILNALRDNRYAETSQLIIEVVYAHFNPDHYDAHFFASNNLAMSAERFRELKGFDETFITSEDRDLCARWLASGLGLTYAPEAIIYHAHGLTLRTLWQQHFGYGRGALRFYRTREARGDGHFKPDLAFYLKLLRSSASQVRKIRAAQMTALLLWSQVANAAGFAYEKYRTGKARPPL
jgi:GT2 family glycosyltransferase